MSHPPDPVRIRELTDSTFEELRAGLEQAGHRGPRMEQRARMRAALGLPTLALAPDPSAAPEPEALAQADTVPGTAAATSQGASLLLKLGLSLAVLLGVGLGLRHVLSPASRAERRTFTRAAERDARTPPNTGAAEPARDALDATPQPPAPATEPHQAATPPSARPRGHPRTPAGRAAGQPPSLEGTTSPDPAGELALLKQARLQARSAPDRALALIALHEARYRAPAFAEEREVIAVEALISAGRGELARQRAAAFFARFPASAHTRRMRVLLEGDLNTKPSADEY